MIPMEEMEGRMSGEAHRQLVRSAVDAGMNTFRLWGGGMYLPPAWYDACDEYGMLIYHDRACGRDRSAAPRLILPATRHAAPRTALRRARRSPKPRSSLPCAAEMFAQGNHGPHGSDIEAAEIRHVVRGLSHHPSGESIKQF
jgi:beta-galactosidase/beta-glucuronidase